MPLYEYACVECGKITEKLVSVTMKELLICCDCGGKAKKIISSGSFIVNGYNEKNGYSKKQ